MKHFDPERERLFHLEFMILSVANDFFIKKRTQFSTRKKKRIHKVVTEFLEINAEQLSDEVKDVLNTNHENWLNDVYEMLISLERTAEEEAIKCEAQWQEFAKCFDPTIEKLFVHLIEDLSNWILCFEVEKGEEVIYIQEANFSFNIDYRMTNPKYSDNFKPGVYWIQYPEIEILDYGYRISYVYEDEIFSIEFANLQLEIKLLNYSNLNVFSGSPWGRINQAMVALVNKVDSLGFEYINEKEKKLWEIQGDIINTSIPGQPDDMACALFMKYASQRKNDGATNVAQQYFKSGPKEKNRAYQLLIKEMVKPSSEAIMREILHDIEEAAKVYSIEKETENEQERFTSIRDRVTRIMIERGYEGEYPHFRKLSSFKGLRLMEMNNQPIIRLNEKNMACLVDCYESFFYGEKLHLKFIISTVFLKKENLHLFPSLDGYSGFFPYKYNSRAFSAHMGYDVQDEEGLLHMLELTISAAAKKAECTKLTKEERENVYFVGSELYGYYAIVGLFLAMGILFGVMMCFGLFLVSLIVGTPFIIFDPQGVTFIDYLRMLLFELPWGGLFLFCAIGFSLPMTLLTVFSKRR